MVIGVLLTASVQGAAPVDERGGTGREGPRCHCRQSMTRAAIEPATHGLKVRLSNRSVTENSGTTGTSLPTDRHDAE